MGSSVGTIGGGIAGGLIGGPAGAAIGSSIGGALLSGGGQSGAASDSAAALQAAAQAAGQTDRFYGGQALANINQAQQLDQTQLQNAYQTASNQQTPYSNVGLNSLDQLAQLTGTAVPQGGSLNSSYLNQYNQTAQQIAQLQQENAQNQATWNSELSGGFSNLDDRNSLQSNIDATTQQIQQLQAQAQGLISNAPADIQAQLQQNYQGVISGQNPSAVTMPANAQGATTGSNPLGGFANSAQAALIGGYDANKTLAQNFQNQPGYGFQLQQGLASTANQNSAQGLTGSAPQAAALLNYGQGLANQSYQQYLTNLGSAAGNYQQQLEGQAQMGQGAANTVSNAALQTGSALSSSNQNMATQAANNLQQTGSNVANSQLGYGAAQAGGITNAANANAANNSATAGLMGSLGPSLFGSSGSSAGASAAGSAGGGLLSSIFPSGGFI